MPNPENIVKHKFKKGVDPKRNIKGRPHKLPALDELMSKVMGELGESGISAMEAILKAQRSKAAKGDTRAAELLLDRSYGKPKQSIDLDITDKRKSIDELFPSDEELIQKKDE